MISENNNNEEMIGVLYNDCYGGFVISKRVIDLYNIKMKGINPEHENILYNENYYLNNIKRHDQVLVDVYNQLGNDFNEGDYTNIKVKYIKKKYENCYYISEYDGLESVLIDINKYKLETIKNIVEDNINSDEKINKIKLFFNSNFK
jgi:hypothetical protein